MKLYANYYKAKEEAKREKLIEAEYGDIYGTDMSYVRYNKTGDRDEEPEIVCYYKWTKEIVKTKNGGVFTHGIPSDDFDSGVIARLEEDWGQKVEEE